VTGTNVVVRTPAERVLLVLLRLGVTLDGLDDLEPSVLLPVREALRRCRADPPAGWPSAAYGLLGREDMVAQIALDAATLERVAIAANSRKNKGGGGGGGFNSGFGGSGSGSGSGAAAAAAAAAPFGGSDADALSTNQLPPEVEALRKSLENATVVPPVSVLLRALATRGSGGADGAVGGADLGGGSSSSSSLSPDGVLSGVRADHEALGRFTEDRRLQEAHRLLRTDRAVKIPSGPPGLNDHDKLEYQQVALLKVSQRTLGLTVGRSALLYGTRQVQLTESASIGDVVVAGQGRAGGAVFRLETDTSATATGGGGSTMDMAKLSGWPVFHSGVAAGLQIAGGKGAVSRAWILYNKPKGELNAAHAGLLLGLGLRGHLSLLTTSDLYRYLSRGHQATNMALLMGLAFEAKGTGDRFVARLLNVHLPPPIPFARASRPAHSARGYVD
jgi:hypothetical protein